jgi:hypothetical protein
MSGFGLMAHERTDHCGRAATLQSQAGDNVKDIHVRAIVPEPQSL